MKFSHALLATSISAALAGCGADVGSGGSVAGNVTSGGSATTLDKSFVSCNSTSNICTLSGRITENYTLDKNFEWRIQGFTFVGDGNGTLASASDVQATKDRGVTLTIPAGVSVKGLADAVLVVTRGSKLMAEGTVTDPITFSSLDNNFDGQGEWGGIIIQGFAPQFGFGNTGICANAAGVCNVSGEGGTEVGKFGGTDAADNSGVLKYVRIAEAGLVAGPNNEVNGLTLQGVGHGTQMQFIQVHGTQDDGIEWFGGTVNARNLVLTNNDDDDIDYDEGYKGNIQYAFIRKHPTKSGPTGTNDPRGIEAGSKGSDTKQVNATTAVLANITVIGSAVSNTPSTATQPGVLSRGEVNNTFHKIAVSNFIKRCFEQESAGATFSAAAVTIQNALCDDDQTTSGGSPVQINVVNTNPTVLDIDSVGAVVNAQASLGTTSTPTAFDNGSGFVFEANAYIGAVDPNTANANRNWMSGWTIPGSLDNL